VVGDNLGDAGCSTAPYRAGLPFVAFKPPGLPPIGAKIRIVGRWINRLRARDNGPLRLTLSCDLIAAKKRKKHTKD
jgi:hypothetical protein